MRDEAAQLQAGLDERGVKWTSERVSDGVLFTFAKDSRTYSVFVRDGAGLEIWSRYLTPEQAIAATLGPREQPPHDQLQAENAKLREYVNAMAIQSYKGEMFDCGYCPFVNQCYNDKPKEHQGRGCQWWLWARELGIEVPE